MLWCVFTSSFKKREWGVRFERGNNWFIITDQRKRTIILKKLNMHVFYIFLSDVFNFKRLFSYQILVFKLNRVFRIVLKIRNNLVNKKT